LLLHLAESLQLDEVAKNKIVQRPPVELLDDPPNIDERMSAIGPKKDGEDVGRDDIPTEV